MNQLFFTLDICHFSDDGHSLIVLDQTLLPNQEHFIELHTAIEVADAIRHLCVRGAPLIGVAAAMGLVVSLRNKPDAIMGSSASFFNAFLETKNIIGSARPTAVNLSWALNRMERSLKEHQELSPSELLTLLHHESLQIKEEDQATCTAIGNYGKELLRDGMGVLTHCNAGHLATSRYGTALAPIYSATEEGKHLHVYADETRPLLQGARLTAYELSHSGIDTTLICDNMAASLMAQGHIQIVLVGCDRVAANGDTANKIGTLGVAIMAHHYGISFYVCGPMSSFDPHCPSGKSINIEERHGDEIRSLWYQQPMAPEGVTNYNPAFDITPIELISGFVTELGIINPRTLHDVLSNRTEYYPHP